MDNLNRFITGKTVVLARRLSTVGHADHIILLDKGKIIEQGHYHQFKRFNRMYCPVIAGTYIFIVSE